MKNIYFIAVCMLSGIICYTDVQSQPIIENIEWSASAYTDNATSEQGTGNFSFTTSAEQFTMSNGQRTLSFSIDRIEGAWNDLETNGEVICRIRSGERLGMVTVGRKLGKLFILIDFSSYKDGMNRTFSIDSFNRL